MPNPYSILPTSRSARDAERELDDAFGSENDHESTPLARSVPTDNVPKDSSPETSVPGAYDFERDYDYPPPGSPPPPSEFALPNNFGNSNGQMPGFPVPVSMPRPSFLRRAVGAVLPTHYTRLPTGPNGSRAIGGGIENDGVFANVMAKPQIAKVVRTEDGEIHIVPEDSQKEAPPSYADAQADTVPPYWETTVHAPSDLDFTSDMIIGDLPSGSIWIFALNLFASFFFQFIGFLLTYLLHTSHAAKFGSRAGLGLTLIQYGFYSRAATENDSVPIAEGETSWSDPAQPSSPLLSTSPTEPVVSGSYVGAVTSREWLAFLFMTLGWFLLLSSVAGFWRVKRWEKSIRATSNPRAVTTEDIERDVAIGRNIESVFGNGYPEEEQSMVRQDVLLTEALAEARLTRDLRAAGLI